MSYRGVPKPKRQRKCAVCGGPIMRRTNAAMMIGYEDPTQPFLHVRDEDWKDNPHDAVEFLVTKSGKELSFEDIEALSAEAERGYDIEKLRPRTR